jgi:hypothetical protein
LKEAIGGLKKGLEAVLRDRVVICLFIYGQQERYGQFSKRAILTMEIIIHAFVCKCPL